MENGGGSRRTPVFFAAIIFSMLVMSLIALFLAVEAYMTRKTIDVVNVALSLSAMFLSVYLLMQMRKKAFLQDSERIRVITVIKCASCDYESTREFEKGDYILREIGSCPKCNGTLLVHSIFREPQESRRKEKSY